MNDKSLCFKMRVKLTYYTRGTDLNKSNNGHNRLRV